MNLRYSLFALLLTIFACSNNEDESPGLKFTPAQLELIHGGSEKTWRVVEVYFHFGQNVLDDKNACLVDDTYTFRADSEIVQMNLGGTACYFDEPDQQATELRLNYWEEEGKLFLNHGRSESKGDLFAAILTILELEELSENRMIFASGTEGNLARAVVLEAID